MSDGKVIDLELLDDKNKNPGLASELLRGRTVCDSDSRRCGDEASRASAAIRRG
jgi:hypothetical protein